MEGRFRVSLLTTCQNRFAFFVQHFDNEGRKTSDAAVFYRQVEKTLQLHMLMETHRGVIVLGKSGSGKTTLIDTLSAAVKTATGMIMKKFVVNPQAQEVDEFLGKLGAENICKYNTLLQHKREACFPAESRG